MKMPLRLLKRESAVNDVHEFMPILAEIEEDPGNPLGPATFWLVVSVFTFFVLWSIFGQVDVVVSARGQVIPAGQVKLVQPLSGGVISQILIKEGDFVKKGQALVVIDPSTTEPSLQSSRETLAHVKLEQARLQASASSSAFRASGSDDAHTQAELYNASLDALEKQLSAKEKALDNLDAQVQAKQVEMKQTRETLAISREKEQRLRDVQDIIAKDDYEKVQNDILTDENKLKELNHELEQLAFQKQQTREEMGYIQQNFKSTTLNDLSEKQKQATQLEASLQESTFKNARQTLTAPVDGYVHELFVHTVGGVVTPAEKIVSIVPVNTPLLIQSTVMNKDIGFVKAGMPVAIKVDTFDFQKYGTLNGVVTQVDKDSRVDQKLGPVYTIYVTPKQHALKVDGKWQNLSSGLSVTSEIKTGKRHIIEFFIYPLIKHLDEGMSVR
jgi:hemolysin D